VTFRIELAKLKYIGSRIKMKLNVKKIKYICKNNKQSIKTNTE